jgi:hypothetical protein
MMVAETLASNARCRGCYEELEINLLTMKFLSCLTRDVASAHRGPDSSCALTLLG